MNDKANYRHLPTQRWDKHCFGCSPTNASGLQMKFYTDEQSVYSWLKIPEHLCGWNNLMHGGVISTMLDEVMGWAAIHLHKLIVLTKSMTIDFIQPVFMSDRLEVKGWISKFDDDGEVTIEGTLHNGQGELCAKSTGIFSYFPPEKIRQMGIMDDSCLKALEEYIAS